MLRRSSVIWVLLVIIPCAGLAGGQGMYKWTDDEGEVHYTQYPPPGRASEAMRPPPPLPAQSAQSADTKLQEQLETIKQQDAQQQQNIAEQKQQAEIQKIRKQNCETARQNLVNLQRGGNVRYRDADGQVVRLTEEERQKRIEETNAQIKENCKH